MIEAKNKVLFGTNRVMRVTMGFLGIFVYFLVFYGITSHPPGKAFPQFSQANHRPIPPPQGFGLRHGKR